MPRLCSLFLLAAFLLLAGPLGAEEEKGAGSPTLPRRCGVCHLERIEQEKTGLLNFLSLRVASAPGERDMCYSCHNGPVRDSRRSAWSGLQHRADGRSTEPGPGVRASCGTCHNPHVQTDGVATFMRFRKGYSAHCLACHPGRGGKQVGNHPSPSSGGAGGGKGRPTCDSCHRVHRASGQGLIRRSTTSRLCAGCHDDNPSAEGAGPGGASHTVAGSGPSCSTCHAVHRAPLEDLLKGATADGTLCLQCHESHSSAAGGEGNHPFVKGRVGCLSCHRAHNAAGLGEKGGLLTESPSALDTLCRACHGPHFDGSNSWNHPVGTAVGEQDKAKLTKFVGYGGIMGGNGTVQCLSCHKAHGSLKGTAGLVVSRQALCLYCHRAQNSLAPKTADFGTHPIAVKPSKATVATAFLEAGGTTGPYGEVACLTCHRAHGGEPEGTGLVLPLENYSCTLCHTAMQEMASTPHGRAGDVGAGGGDRDTCGSCHSSHGWNIPLEETGMGGSVIEKVCWHCHGLEGSVPMRGYFGHILGVTPSGGTGGRDLPLFWDDGRRLKRGLLTCATCHDVHRDPVEYSLRLKSGEKRAELCLGCHRRQEAVKGTKHDLALYFPGEKNRLGETASSTGTCGACHLAHSSGLGDSWAREAEPSPGEPGRLFPFCADCHSDGSFAQGDVVSERTHPVPDVIGENPEMGAVDCDGCHDTHVWNPINPADKGDFFSSGDNSTSFLVSPSSGRSPLCLKCHSAESPVAETKHDLAAKGDGEGLCEVCHLAHGGQKLLMWPYPLEKEESYGSEICLRCHERGGEGADHPLAVSPGAKPGKELPLYLPSGRKYFRGKVSCGTCHNPHIWSPSSAVGGTVTVEGSPATSFLRMEADGYSPLCFPCHAERSMIVGTDHDLRVTAPDTMNLDGLTADESGVCGSCHSVHGARHLPFLWNREEGPGEDPRSRYCRGCHDEEGIDSATTPPRLESHLVSYPGKGMVSRPFTRRQRSLFGAASSLALYDTEGEKKDRGYISCATCHDVHRWEPETSRSGMGTPLDGDSQNSFLKERSTFSIGGSLCKECHGEDTLELYRQYHFPEGAPAEPRRRGAGE